MNNFDPTTLPPVIASYLERPATEQFAAAARVVDEGIERRGTDAIAEWLSTTASEFTFTSEFTGQQQVDADRWIVRAHLEGNFPGGVVDLLYRFTVAGERIGDLVIAP